MVGMQMRAQNEINVFGSRAPVGKPLQERATPQYQSLTVTYELKKGQVTAHSAYVQISRELPYARHDNAAIK